MTTTPGSFPPDVEEAGRRLADLCDRVIEMGTCNGLAFLAASETVLESLLFLGDQLAAGAQLEWVSALVATHADFVREVSNVYFDMLRSQLGQ